MVEGRKVAAVLFALLSVGAPTVLGGKEPETTIQPGAKLITPEEAAIKADALNNLGHAVILIDETDNQERSYSRNNEISHHCRIKILSGEARDLADIEIPFRKKQISRWWGFTIQPDGTVLELPLAELVEQRLIKVGSESETVTRAVLPGVRPGSIIDYGWTGATDVRYAPGWVSVQQSVPVKKWRYRWVTTGMGATAFAINDAAKRLPLRSIPEPRGITIEGSNVPPSVKEPYGLPVADSAGALLFHYSSDPSIGDASLFWLSMGNGIREHLKLRYSNEAPLRRAISHVSFDSNATPIQKLRQVYDWMQASFRNLSLLSREESEQVDWDNEKLQDNDINSLLQLRQGNSWQLSELFYGYAKLFGITAEPVYVCDRTDTRFNFGYLNLRQFDSLVIRLSGSELGQAVYVAPAMGLPFGQVPWWYAGADALVVNPAGGALVYPVSPSTPDESQSTTVATLTLTAAGTTNARWTSSGTGQYGYSERRQLRRMTPEDRTRQLRNTCGESANFAVHRSNMPAVLDLSQRYELSCEGELLDAQFDLDSSLLELSFRGPWLDAVPILEIGRRTQRIEFRFPRTELAEIEVVAPDGFKPGTPPESKQIPSAFGDYKLTVIKRERSFAITRSFVLKQSIVAPDQYSGLVSFLRAVRSADQSSLAFVRVP